MEQTATLRGIRTSVYSADQLLKISVAEVKKPGTTERGLPATGGPNDRRFGVPESDLRCATCRGAFCQGHWGHVKLAKPVYVVGHIPTLLGILRCTCWACARLRIEDADFDSDSTIASARRDADPKKRLRAISDIFKNKNVCVHCKRPQRTFRVRKDRRIFIEATSDVPTKGEPLGPWDLLEYEKPWTAMDTFAVLDAMRDEDIARLGFDPEVNHPKHLIKHIQPIPPPAIRPAGRGATGRGEDDLTRLLSEIVKANVALISAEKYLEQVELAHPELQRRRLELLSLREPDTTMARDFFEHEQSVLGEARSKVRVAHEILQARCAEMVNVNSTNGLRIEGAERSFLMLQKEKRQRRQLKDLSDRLSGKNGRMRHNLRGKRNDFNSRGVVGPDTSLDIWELGVPKAVMEILTFPEHVTRWNMEEMRQRVRNGVGNLFGARNVIIPNLSTGKPQETIYLGFMEFFERDRLASKLQLGWVIERFMKDGDRGLFNRQPTLHKGSLLMFETIGVSGNTFRLPLPDTTTFNADYDGDEMNLHLMQNVVAAAEASELMSVSYNIVTPQNNKPTIGLVQDSILSAWKLTRTDVFIKPHAAMQFLMGVKYCPRGPEYRLAPPSYEVRRLMFGSVSDHWNVTPAVWARGRGAFFTGKQLFSFMLPEDMFLRKGEVLIEQGEILMGRLDKSTLAASAGGIVDVLYKDYGHWAAAKFISDAQRVLMAYLNGSSVSVGLIDCLAADDAHDAADDLIKDRIRVVSEGAESGAMTEPLQMSTLQRVMNEVGGIVLEKLPESNGLFALVSSGAKGNLMNVAQIMGCLGQQVIEGHRFRGNFVYAGMPNFGGTPVARALMNRVGNETSPVAKGFIASSFLRGLTVEEFFIHAAASREGLKDTAIKTAQTGYNQRRMMKATEAASVLHDGTVRNAEKAVLQFRYGEDDFDAAQVENVKLPSAIVTAILAHDFEQALSWWNCRSEIGSIEVGSELREILREAFDALYLVHDARKLRHKWDPFFDADDMTLCLPWEPRRLAERYRGTERVVQNLARRISETREVLRSMHVDHGDDHDPSKVSWAYLLWSMNASDLANVNYERFFYDGIVPKYARALVSAGESVGAVCAVSLGEVVTQLTLDSFHSAGVGEKNATTGLPRLQELINGKDTSDTGNMLIRIDNPSEAERALVHMPELWLRHIVRSITFSPLTPDTDFDTILVDDTMTDNSDCSIDHWRRRVFNLSLNDSTDNFVRKLQKKTKLGATAPICMNMTIDAKKVGSRFEPWDLVWRLQKLVSAEDFWCTLVSYDESTIQCMCTVSPSATPYDQQSFWLSLKNYMLEKILVDGVVGVRRCLQTEHGIETEGSSLQSFWAHFDLPNAITNNVLEVERTLGIEAARIVLERELVKVLSSDGTYINARHPKVRIVFFRELLWAPYSSVGRAEDCRLIARALV